MLSGHIHTFEAINYDGKIPPQIVAGHGGDNLDPTPANLRGAIFQGHSGVSVKDGLSVGGFGFLMMTRDTGDGRLDDPALRLERERQNASASFAAGSRFVSGRRISSKIILPPRAILTRVCQHPAFIRAESEIAANCCVHRAQR